MIEMFNGAAISYIPGLKNEVSNNPYDCGRVANFLQTFGLDPVLYFLPTIPRVRFQGYFFPETPVVTA
jgi:hypothetical protein